MERSVFTSGDENTRANSMTSAVPEPSSFAASPQPCPSIWPPTMYISSGCVVPTLVQYTSSRGPGALGCMLSARSFSSGWRMGSVFTPVGPQIAAQTPAAGGGARSGRFRRPARLRLLVGRVTVVQALGVRAAVTLELRLDPVDGRAIAVGALAAVAELGEPLDRRLVALEIETSDQNRDGIGRRTALRSGNLCKRRRKRGGRYKRAGEARGDDVEAHDE